LSSFVKNSNPLMRSGLVFAGANDVWNEVERDDSKQDGILTAYEVANLNLQNTRLVVLSACETGLGDIRGSEGVYGLQRAFKMAGSKYLIMSLWQVSDKETVEFMETFYTKLLGYKDIRKAFNETQREMCQKYDPFYWAAFVLVE
jgi:CHAT domain-containing protein